DEPSTPPSDEPSDEPSEQPSEQPTEPPTDGPTKIALENLTGHDVFIAIDDDTGTILDARSGTPGDGMSVRWLDVKVENIDADTLRVVWVGLPRDEVVYLDVSTVDDKLRLRFVQDGPPPYSDAIGFDRILELSFDQPVRSEDVLTSIQEGLDT
ncbi:MAG TPA: PT domain-containing protein, partial [Candidatus Limnocylindrales bacterium]|nr:PT domain-containing protein [Candidatus Limnocylindrales bacterium]